MSGWNLPPGVSLSMIPGNRPEEEAEERFWEALMERVPADLAESLPDDWADDGPVARLVEIVRDLAWEHGRAEERAETEIVASMTAPELGLTVQAVNRLLGRE